MENIDINATKSTPRIIMDHERLVIEGQSYPEDSGNFYKPVLKSLKEVLGSLKGQMIIDIRLIYLNTSSSRAMMLLFDIADEEYKKGKDIVINWYYNSGNEMARETGEEFEEDLSVPFRILLAEEL